MDSILAPILKQELPNAKCHIIWCGVQGRGVIASWQACNTGSLKLTKKLQLLFFCILLAYLPLYSMTIYIDSLCSLSSALPVFKALLKNCTTGNSSTSAPNDVTIWSVLIMFCGNILADLGTLLNILDSRGLFITRFWLFPSFMVTLPVRMTLSLMYWTASYVSRSAPLMMLPQNYKKNWAAVQHRKPLPFTIFPANM